MSENKESLSTFADKSQKSISEFNQILGRTILVSPNEEQYDLLLKRLKQQLGEGRGEVILEIGSAEDGTESGLSEDELEAAIATLQSLASSLECSCVKLRDRKDLRGTVVQFLIRRLLDQSDFLEIRVAVVGNVDAGKSTLLGVLTHGELDNGRGHARQKLFRHKHEMESGRTSSVGNDILGFDGEGNVVNKPEHGSLDWVKICEKSSKVITFIDLAGHERYLKTTVFGMTGHAPDFGMLMIGANAGIIGMTKEHLGLALALSVPVFVVVTKIDMCPANVLQDNLKMLVRILKSPGCRKVPVMVKSTDDVVLSATNFVSERLCPIFQVSNVNGENLGLLKTFLNLLTTRMEYKENEPAEFQIDDTYSVPGVGTVVSGTTLKGVIKLNDTLMLGPDPLGHFQPIAVKSIHRKRMAVREVRAGQTASFALKKIKRSQIRKGMVMVCPSLNPQACWEFEGEILVLHHPTTISSRYQAMVHCGSIRQTASIISMSQECLRTGDKALIHFRFIKYPEYMVPGQRMVFREGRTKAVGNVVKIFTHTPTSHIGTKSKTNKQQQQRYNVASQGGGKSGNYFSNLSQALPTGQSLQQLKISENKCEYFTCRNSSETYPRVKLFPFPKDQRYKKWIINSGNISLKNLSLDQLHRKHICSNHFQETCYTDKAKTKLHIDAAPIPYKNLKFKKPVLMEENGSTDKLPIKQNITDLELIQRTSGMSTDHLKKLKTGYNSHLFTQLKYVVDKIKDDEKYCSLAFDEISIKGQIKYCELLDEMEGFQDFGPFGRLSEIGNEIMLFTVQGIYSDWKVPVAYFISVSGIKTHLLSKLIYETTKRVQQTGLKIVSIVSDQGHNNVPAIRRLGVTTQDPYFHVDSKKVYAIFDVPNLFKSIKNNFMDADFLYKEEHVSFKDVVEIYRIDKAGEKEGTLGLNESHINPGPIEKFQISLALEIFSNSVASYMKTLISTKQLKSSTAQNTANFINDLSELFDCLNSSSYENGNSYKCAISTNNPHVRTKLVDLKQCISKMYKLNENGLKAPRSFSGLIQTINAILMIYDEQKILSFNSLLTSKFNIEPTQDFFTIFSKKKKQSVATFRQVFYQQCINGLVKLSSLSNNLNTVQKHIDLNDDENYNQLNIDEDLIPYLTGYWIRISQEKYDCENCKKKLQQNEVFMDKRALELLSQYYGIEPCTLQNIKKPSDEILKYIERAQKVFKKVYYDNCRKYSISEYINREIIKVLFSTLEMEQCKPHLEFVTRKLVIFKLHKEFLTQDIQDN